MLSTTEWDFPFKIEKLCACLCAQCQKIRQQHNAESREQEECAVELFVRLFSFVCVSQVLVRHYETTQTNIAACLYITNSIHLLFCCHLKRI